MKTRPFSIFTKTSLISLILVLSGCATNPVTGKKQVSLMSEQQEIALGAESDPQIIAQYGLYENNAIQQFIESHGQEMAQISHRPNLKFHFRVLDSPVVNAFAVPGGYVYFTRGIMAHFNNEAAFTGVLGHEIGHITAKHSVQQYTNSTIAQVLLMGGMVVSKELRAFANEAQLGVQLLFLKYSRDHETQSDELGVEYSTKVGYDAREMADFFRTLDALSEGSEEIPTFLSTHPNPSDRHDKVEKLAAEWQATVGKPSYKVNRDTYLRMVDGIIYGEDPREGYVEGNVFYHPELKFQFPVPANWQVMNSPQQVQMVPSNGKALLMLYADQGSLESVAEATTSELKLTITNSRQFTVNGLQAIEVIGDQVSQDPNTGKESSVRVQSVFIKYGNLIYIFHGVATPADFGNYKPDFDRTMYGFKQLTDQSKINVSPERIKVVEVKKTGTIGEAFSAFNIPSGRQKELAVINGRVLSDQVQAGSLIKILVK